MSTLKTGDLFFFHFLKYLLCSLFDWINRLFLERAYQRLQTGHLSDFSVSSWEKLCWLIQETAQECFRPCVWVSVAEPDWNYHIFCQLCSCFSFAYLHIVSTRNKAYLAAHKIDLVEVSIIVPMLIYTVIADDWLFPIGFCLTVWIQIIST